MPFDIQRVYYLYDVSGGSERGGHAHKGLHHIKAARHRHDERVQALVGVAAALGAARHVLQIVDPLDVEGHMHAAFDERQVGVGAWLPAAGK